MASFPRRPTGHRFPVFDMYEDGADLVETSFLMEGLLSARQYFKADGPSGRELYDRVTKLWEGVEWKWFEAMPKHDALYWHWSPEYSFYIANRLTGWNEVMITYLEAIASPTHAIAPSDYYSGWVGEGINNQYANGKSYEGIMLPVGGGTGGPLFFTDYSFMGFDPRGIHDRFTDYFDNNRAQAEINRAYCVRNPHGWAGYGADTWGLTAVDDPAAITHTSPRSIRTMEPSLPPGRSARWPIRRKHRWPRCVTSIAISARRCGASTDSATPSTCSKTGIPELRWD